MPDPQLMEDEMSDFTPKWPHGHVTRDGRAATIYAVLKSGWVVGSVENQTGGTWYPDGRWSLYKETALDLINAPVPKRTWDVVAVEWHSNCFVTFCTTDRFPKGGGGGYKIVGRYKLTEGEGMEDEDDH